MSKMLEIDGATMKVIKFYFYIDKDNILHWNVETPPNYKIEYFHNSAMDLPFRSYTTHNSQTVLKIALKEENLKTVRKIMKYKYIALKYIDDTDTNIAEIAQFRSCYPHKIQEREILN